MTKAEKQQLKTDGYRDGASDARKDMWNPRKQRSTVYMKAYGQAHSDHHKIGPAPKAEALHLRPVL